MIPNKQAESAETARHWVLGATLLQLDELEQQYPGEGQRVRGVLVELLATWEPLASKAVAS